MKSALLIIFFLLLARSTGAQGPELVWANPDTSAASCLMLQLRAGVLGSGDIVTAKDSLQKYLRQFDSDTVPMLKRMLEKQSAELANLANEVKARLAKYDQTKTAGRRAMISDIAELVTRRLVSLASVVAPGIGLPIQAELSSCLNSFPALRKAVPALQKVEAEVYCGGRQMAAAFAQVSPYAVIAESTLATIEGLLVLHQKAKTAVEYEQALLQAVGLVSEAYSVAAHKLNHTSVRQGLKERLKLMDEFVRRCR